MMMTYLNLSFSLLIPFSIGYTALLFLFNGQPMGLSLKISLAYGLGLGILAAWMLLLGIFGQPFSVFSIGLPLIIFAVLFFVLSLRKRGNVTETNKNSLTPNNEHRHWMMQALHAIFVMGLLLYVFSNILYVFWRSMTIPIATWDAIATVAFKAKIFYFEQSLPSLHLLPHKTYPLFVPFVQSWIAFNLGTWDDLLIKIIFPCAFLSYLVIHYKFLAHFTNKTWGLLGCAVLLSSNLFLYHATISYRDFFLMYFNCITIMLLLFWNQNKTGSFLMLAGLFAGLATFVKLEGTAYLGIYFTLFALINFPSKTFTAKEKIINTVKFSLFSLGICLTFHIYKIWNQVLQEGTGIVDKTKLDFTLDKMSAIPEIFTRILQNLLLSGNWNIIWFVALLSLIQLAGKKRKVEAKLILLCLLLFFGLYFFVALLTVNYVWIAGEMHSTTLSRIILHFYPLSVLLIVLLNYSDSPLERKNTSFLNPK